MIELCHGDLQSFDPSEAVRRIDCVKRSTLFRTNLTESDVDVFMNLTR